MSTFEIQLVLAGAILLGLLVSALFFLRFWRKTTDRLFVWFAAAFLMLAAERVLLVWGRGVTEAHPSVYLVRLCAFGLIIGALIDKNRSNKT